MTAWIQRRLASRYRISTQLLLGIWGAVALTVAAGLVGWFSFNRVGDEQSRVNEGSVPELAAAFGVADYSSTLVAAAPRLTTAPTLEDVARVAISIDEAYAALEAQLAVLERGAAEDERVQRIRAHADSLIANIEAIEADMAYFFDLTERSAALRLELADLRFRLDSVVIPAIDDQFFYAMTGYRTLGEPPAPRNEHFSETEFSSYRRLAEMQADASIAEQLLASASILSEPALLEALRERFEAAARRIQRNLAALESDELRAEVAPVFDLLLNLGIGDETGFDLLATELELVARQRDLLASNQEITVDLIAEVNSLVSAAQASVEEATGASTQAIFTGRVLLLAISAVSVTGAVLIAWLFVGRFISSRLQRLSDWMRRLAGGDLETTVELSGRDEIAEMAAALEVFRQHALEIQRLNLVEKLANELQSKNDQLETALGDLQRAQDQIVSQQKLAALGELTAGVAHEIKNPLNFVKNFSEVSEELIDELKEVLDEEAESISEDQREYIDEIAGDLTDNLGRIRSHGDRANHIVHDMLMMGRGSGDRQSTDINRLLDEHARLAYHSARATDTEFQLDLKQDMDPEVGELEVVPQDLGRVFLNMVSNACYATDEKRRSGADADGERYFPTLWLATRRGAEHIEVRIKDNGMGMPDDIIDKIFNPFFTTKPTDQGTGLGLAISSDIVRQHGGNIRVESEPGEGTEMIIELPLEPPAAALAGAGDGDGAATEATSL
ncbi:MAG: ATP-binding protein [Chloroflexota bacterium]|nr:ATP-binding protein [Chloroflexota bacterium]